MTFRRIAIATAAFGLLASPAEPGPPGPGEDGVRAVASRPFECGSGPDLPERAMAWHAEASATAAPATESIFDYDIGNVAVLLDDGNLVVTGHSDTLAAVQQFYVSHPDDFDYLVIYYSSAYNFDVQIEAGFAFHMRVASDVLGIGINPIDRAAELGLSTTRLRSILQMNDLLEDPPLYDQDALPQFLGSVEGVEVLAHEAGHQFGSFVEVPGEGMLGRQGSHWSFFMNSLGSVMEGNAWQQIGNNQFLTGEPFEHYTELDEYVMGLRDAAAVTEPIFVIQDPKQTGGKTAASTPEEGITIRGTRRDITIAEIVAAQGPRMPSAQDAPHSFRMAFALVVPTGMEPPLGDLDRMERFRRAFVEWFAEETEGVGAIDTSLPGVEVAADFAADVFAGSAPLGVAFHDRSSGPVTARLWEFGDRETSTEVDPVHTYAQDGFYSVRLTVQGPDSSDVRLRTGYVVVQPFDDLASDDFEVEPGSWRPEFPPTASTGFWLQVAPEATFQNGVPVQAGQDATADPGSLAWITGNGPPGETPGFNDVDGGEVALLSEVFDLSGVVQPVVEIALWYSNDLGGGPGSDPFRVEVSGDGGASWFPIHSTRRGDRSWRTVQIRVTDAIIPTDRVRFRFVAQDFSTASLVEAGVDDFRLLALAGFPDGDGDGVPDAADNCPANVNASQFDQDQDGHGQNCDCDDQDPAATEPAGTETTITFDPQDPQRIVWTGLPLAVTYNLYRGQIGPGGAFDYVESCFSGNLTPLEATDLLVPAPGGLLFYLVSARNDCGEDSLGTASDGTARFLATPCPPPFGG